jgi:hypothetical protein
VEDGRMDLFRACLLGPVGQTGDMVRLVRWLICH